MTPNQISVFSAVFATAAAALMLMAVASGSPQKSILLLLAAFCIQMRLLCNLLDGLMAVEGGKKSAVGELFNEFPDRVSDSVVLLAAGYAAGAGVFGITLGWLCTVLALTTAYIRAFGAHCTGQQDFCGPMAKQHRMFVMTVGLIASSLLSALHSSDYSLIVALVVIALGSAVTCVRRTYRLARRM